MSDPRFIEIRHATNRQVEVIGGGPRGEKGEKGDQGEQGPAGTPGSAPQAYTHNQGDPSTVWSINHNLGYPPAAWHVEDSAGNDHDPSDIEDVDLNNTNLYFDYPFGGTAKGS